MLVRQISDEDLYAWRLRLDGSGVLSQLLDNGVNVFCDIRARRAVRGADYAFANAVRLEARLGSLKIAYVPAQALAAPPYIREQQKQIDAKTNVGQRKRLSAAFVAAYATAVLDSFDFGQLVQQLEALT